MKRILLLLLGLLLLTAPAIVQAQFTYIVNADNTITVTGYTGPPWALTIPTNINGLTVTCIGDGEDPVFSSSVTSVTILDGTFSIADYAFQECTGLTSVTIPGSVTNIGEEAFWYCTSLTNVTIPNGVSNIGEQAFWYCTSLASVSIPGSVTNTGYVAFSGDTSLTSLTIQYGATSIAEQEFANCTSLTSVRIPGSVTNIAAYAFQNCTKLASVFFSANPPTADSTVFAGDNSNPVIYYLPGTSGWSSPFASRQALLWNPLIQNSGTSFGLQSNQFGFNITGTAYIAIVVETCTNLASPVWFPLETLALTNGSFYFSEPLQTNSSCRYYRIGPP
jgi:hypothetical protein